MLAHGTAPPEALCKPLLGRLCRPNGVAQRPDLAEGVRRGSHEGGCIRDKTTGGHSAAIAFPQ